MVAGDPCASAPVPRFERVKPLPSWNLGHHVDPVVGDADHRRGGDPDLVVHVSAARIIAAAAERQRRWQHLGPEGGARRRRVASNA